MRHSFLRLAARAARSTTIPVLLLAFGSVTACAQSPAGMDELKSEIETLKQQHKETQRQLDRLEKILRPVLEQLPQPFEPQEVSVEGSPTSGVASAPITIVEFSDLQCPFCVRFYENTYPEIMRDYVETGKVRYVAREFPLTSIHKEAQRASQGALCAGEQDKYWEMRAEIFRNRQALSDEDLVSYAKRQGVDIGTWETCMASDTYARKVEADIRAGAKLGIRGTPAFVIGKTDPDDPTKFQALDLLEGAYPFSEFQEKFEGLLNE
jgi:protein-disulfide isomerase